MRQAPSDHDVRQRIYDDFGSNMLIEASAGTGKTECLCRRIANSLLIEKVPPEQIVAITFTRKAAAELRGRLRLVLERALQDSSDPELVRRCQTLLERLEEIFIGTIHSFCSRLLREYPFEAGVVPGFTELEGPAYRELLVRCLGEAVNLTRIEDAQLLEDIFDGGLRLQDLVPGFEKVCQQPDVSFVHSRVGRPETDALLPAIERFLTKLEVYLPERIEDETTCDVQKRFRKFEYLSFFQQSDRPAQLAKCLSVWRTGLKPTYKWWPGKNAGERKASANSALALINDFVEGVAHPFVVQWRSFLYTRIMKLFEMASELFERERVSSARLDFGDLLLLAAGMVRSDLNVRKALQSKIRHILVDEFQDTDPLQAEVLLLLSSEPSYEGSSWQEAPLRAGALFVVGDPKQSIYRFRRADIEIFELVRRRIKSSGGTSLTLSASFRSTPTLCSWSNRVFSDLLPSASTREQAGFSALDPVKGESDASLSGVSVLTTQTKAAKEVSQTEAHRMAATIAEAVQSGDYRYSDFMILTLKRDQLSHYYQALTALGVPTEIAGGIPQDWPLCKTFLQLLRTLTTPDDGVALVGILRSILYGLSDQQLYEHKQSGGRFRWTSPDVGEESVCGALEDLKLMREWVREFSASAAADKILNHTGLLILAHATGDGSASALLQLVQQIRGFSLTGLSLGQALDTIELSEPEFPVSLTSGRLNVVRVMNLHQAKGLQARVVFLAAPTSGLSDRISVRVVRRGSGAVGFLQLRDYYQVIAQPADWDDHAAEESTYLLAERLRLLYVAVTRAQEALVVSRWLGKDGRVSEGWLPLYPFLEGLPELPTVTVSPLQSADGPRISDPGGARVERLARWAEASEPSWARTSVTARVVQEKLKALPFHQPDNEGSLSDVGGVAWGDLVHKLLERLASHPNLTDEELEKLAVWYCYDEPELADAIPKALQAVRAVAQDEFWQSVIAADSRLVEVPFASVTGDRKKLLFGVVDLALESEQGWSLVDYKTDRQPLENLLMRYSSQLQSYAQHWTQLTNEPVDYSGIYRVRSQELSDDVSGKTS